MENEGFARVRVEGDSYEIGRKWGIWALALVFGGSLAIGTAIGAHGPVEFLKASDELRVTGLDAVWTGHVTELTRWHQQLYLHMRLANPSKTNSSLTYEQDLLVKSWASTEPVIDVDGQYTCPEASCAGCDKCTALTESLEMKPVVQCVAGETWCDWTTLYLQNFVEYPTYYMEVHMSQPEEITKLGPQYYYLDFEIVFYNSDYTHWQMKWFYLFTAITLCFMFLPRLGFFTEMMRTSSRFWSRQQIWVGILLVSLLLYNNFLFGAQILSPFPLLFFDISMVMRVTFLSTMLLFWLEVFSDMAEDGTETTAGEAARWRQQKVKAFREMVPQLVLIALMWLTSVLIYNFERVGQDGDPSVASVDNFSAYTGVKVARIILAVVYFIWLLILILKAVRNLPNMAPPYRFIFVMTLFTIGCTAAGYIMGWLVPSVQKASAFAFFIVLYNAYVLILAWCYTPVGSHYAMVTVGANGVELGRPKGDDDEEFWPNEVE